MLTRRATLAGLGALGALPLSRPSRAAGSRVILFEQPSYMDGIAPHFSVTNVVPAYNPIGAFYMHANQPNAFAADSNFVPVTWGAASRTGLVVPADRQNWQRGIVLPNGHSNGRTIAQMHGNKVGGFLNSLDLVNGSPGNRMMISPNYAFPTPIQTFGSGKSVLGISLDLQVPTATDFHTNGLSNTYAKIDVLFVCTSTGTRLSLSCGLFGNASYPKHDGFGYDDIANSVIISPPVSTVTSILTLQPGTATFQSAPWTGWKTFSMTMSTAQFATGLAACAPIAASYGQPISLDPADYTMTTTHLNAELHYTTSMPASIGWSMRNLVITQVH